MTGEKAGYTAALNGLSITEKPRAGKKMACSLRQGGVYDILGPAKHREVPGAALRLAGRIGKQVQSLCGTAAVWGEFRPTMPLRKREGWPERRPPSRKTCPAVHTARRPAACRGGGEAGDAPRTDQTPAWKIMAQGRCARCALVVRCFLEGPGPSQTLCQVPFSQGEEGAFFLQRGSGPAGERSMNV